MTPFMQLVLELVIILVAAKVAGYLATRLGQPSVLGELLVGVLLGPSLLDILHLPFINSESLGATISELSELGVLLLMFIAGLELHLGELTKNRRVSLLASLGGLILSIGLGWAAGRLFHMENQAAWLMGLALAATSVSISARTLMEMGLLRSRVGLSLLGAAVIDDVLSILTFSIFLAVQSGTDGISGLIWTGVRMALFLALAITFGRWVLPAMSRVVARLSISQGVLAFALVMMLLYGLAAEVVGNIAAIIGAFLAGLAFARTPEKTILEPGIHSLAYGLFTPLFFINIGLSVNLRNLETGALWLMVLVTIVAVIGKFLGAGGGSRLAGLSGREAFQVGAGMVARGEVTLIIIAMGKGVGLISSSAFSAVVAAVLFSTLITPALLRLTLHGIKPEVPNPAEEKGKNI